MKFTTLISIALLMCGQVMGQDESTNLDSQYLFGGSNPKLSGFGGFYSSFGQARGNFAHYSGGGGALLIDYKFFIGGYGLGMSGNTNFEDIYTELGTEQYSNLCTSLGMGGLWLGYSFNHHKPIHFATSIKSGIGSVSVYPKNFERNDYSWIYTDIVGMIEPEIQVELNLFRWWRMQFGVGYRFVLNIDDDTYFNKDGEKVRYFKDNDFSTPTIGFSMLFGNFGPKNDKD